ncbi:unnamed protein product [Lasius platythorax]|uniref:Beta-ketoacyl synthase-like N-terminal domain-containing protein n=1 Tax=Lasius platythorax TaxID=488582 RepID=A0AAV2MYI9_9HYME
MIANRISYWLGVTGPSYSIDTACSSSSHFAMVEAYKMIRSGICEAAIVASVNLCIHPYITCQFFVWGFFLLMATVNLTMKKALVTCVVMEL